MAPTFDSSIASKPRKYLLCKDRSLTRERMGYSDIFSSEEEATAAGGDFASFFIDSASVECRLEGMVTCAGWSIEESTSGVGCAAFMVAGGLRCEGERGSVAGAVGVLGGQ